MRHTFSLMYFVLCVAATTATGADQASGADITFRELRRFSIPEAHQAVAVDATSFYGIANHSIARYEKKTGNVLEKWSAPENSDIKHLNSGLVHEGRLYCANSNWPEKPLKNTVEIFNAETLQHSQSKPFAETAGAINWIERHHDAWWIVFAYYGEEDVHHTRLVRYDDDWNETGRWTFPDAVLNRFLPNSNSGGAFGPNGRLFVTGHDHAELYVLNVPADGGTLQHLTTVPAPIAGQGIAWDRSDIGTLFGIVRKTHEVVVMRQSHRNEYSALKQPVEWVRDEHNPVLPPRKGEFDATRCMNPWVVRDGDNYRLFYSGGGADGKQRLGVATAAVRDVVKWDRTGPLFETGNAGAFDAAWCVLPHAIKMNDDRWHLYYTGNAGRGSGLSAFPGMGLATSTDGTNWARHSEEPILEPSGEHGTPDAIGVAGGSVVRISQPDGSSQWRFYYTGCPTVGKAHELNQQKTICLATSDDGIHWTKLGTVMLRDPERNYEDIGVAGPVVHQEPDGSFRMWYSAIGTRHGYYSICYAESDDGIHWRRGVKSGDNLQLLPNGNGWEKQMVEYPSVIQEGDHLRLFYCGNGYGRTGIGTAVSKVPAQENQAAKVPERFQQAKDRTFKAFDSQQEQQWQGPYFFLQMADTQYGMFSGNKGFEKEAALAQQAVEHINRLRPKFAIVCGDLTNATPEQARYQAQVAQYHHDFSKVSADIPLVCVCGNHDVGNRPTPQSIAQYQQNFGDDYFAFWTGGVRNIVLNSSVLKDPTGAPEVLAAQEEWLKQQLHDAQNAKARHTLIFQHHPLFLEKEDEPDQYFNIPLERRTPLVNQLKEANVRAVFAGHYHRNAYGKAGEMEMITTGPVGKPFAKTVSGFRIVTVQESGIQHQYYGMDEVPEKVTLPDAPAVP